MKIKTPSPCVDVCKYKRASHCIACSMTKPQKSMFKKLKAEKHRLAFLQVLVAQQNIMGKYAAWPKLYAKKCKKKRRPASGRCINETLALGRLVSAVQIVDQPRWADKSHANFSCV